MLEATVNTFIKGLNRDVSPNKYSPENYFDGLNVRLFTDKSLSSFSISNEKGNTNVFNIPSTQAVYELQFYSTTTSQIHITINGVSQIFYKPTSGWTYDYFFSTLKAVFSYYIALGNYQIYNQADRILIVGLNTTLTVSTNSYASIVITNILPAIQTPSIIGSCQLRDYLILFTVGSTTPVDIDAGLPSVSNGQIWKLKILEDGSVENTGTGNYLTLNEHLIYTNNLNFSTAHRIEAYGNYETPEVGKIYFTDNYNNFRHFNVLAESAFSVPLSALNIIPDVLFGTQTITKVLSSGTYSSGMIQYAHQYYNLHGSQSAFSPTTGLIHLTKSPETLSDTKLYYGTATGLPTGKTVQFSISNLDRRFTNVRVVALYYKTSTSTPEITIIDDREIPVSASINITDDGSLTKGLISDVEFSAFGSVNFQCKTFDVKDNILFPANITEDFYDIDEEGYWDSRAYRWAYDASNDSYRNTFLESSTTSGISFNSLALAANVNVEHDCIQSKSLQYSNFYAYTKTNQRLGGEGVNVKYYFNLDTVVEDDNATNVESYKVVGNNGAFSNYADPLVHANKVGYMRDEIYRFGVVFFDKNGRKSFVKWIADIKMPSMWERDTAVGGSKYYKTFNKVGNTVVIHILSLTFELKNLPASAVSYEIVRMQREDKDKTVVMQGVLVNTNKPNTVSFSVPNQYPSTFSTISSNTRLFNFISPEVNFLKELPDTGSLQIVGAGRFNSTGPIGSHSFYKVNDLTTQLSAIPSTLIAENRIVPPGYDASYSINNYQYKNYRYLSSAQAGFMCTNMVVSTNDPIYEGEFGSLNAYAITNIVRSIQNQYGGNTYTARFNNKYIGCISVKSASSIKVYGGDTYIGYFCNLYGIFDLTESNSENICVDFLFPVESSINLSLRHDHCFYKTDGGNTFLMQETAGEHVSSNSEHYSQSTDLYLYNQVYSKENTTITYFSKPINFSNNKSFDARILSSDVKRTNEEIDSWTSFLATNYIDVDATYGPINKLITFNKKIVFFQDKALGWASVNERSLITPDSGGAQLSLGKGGVLDQYFYASRHSGSRHQFSVIYSPNGLYYYDSANNRLNVFTGEQSEPISELKGFSSYLKQNTPIGIKKVDNTIQGLGVHGIYDQRLDRILWTFNDMFLADEFTIGYNELTQCFESFYSFKPKIYIKYDENIYSTDPAHISKGYLHNSGNYGEFYGDVFDSSISVLVNKDPNRSKAFTNIEYGLNILPEANVNFESIQVSNNYQDTGVVILNDSNCNKRSRKWRITLGRNNNPSDGSRIISEYAIIKLVFDNANQIASNVLFKLSDIVTYYMSRYNI